MLIGASLVLFGVVLIVMTHDLRQDVLYPAEGTVAGRSRLLGLWWGGVALVTVGVALAAGSFLVV